MKLSEHFTLSELTYNSKGLENTPDVQSLNNLKLLVNNVLEPLRVLYGKPIHINSGYRNPIVNRNVGGVSNSAHLTGRAADITGGSKEENKKLYDLIKDNFEFRQLIWEKGDKTGPDWVHLEYNIKNNKKQLLKL